MAIGRAGEALGLVRLPYAGDCPTMPPPTWLTLIVFVMIKTDPPFFFTVALLPELRRPQTQLLNCKFWLCWTPLARPLRC